MLKKTIDLKAEEILSKRLFDIPLGLADKVPDFLFPRKDWKSQFFSILTPKYYFLALINPKSIDRIDEKYVLNNLITTIHSKHAMFKIDNSKNIVVSDMRLDTRGSNCFLIGDDSTLVLQKIRFTGRKDILIDLGFIISFGKEITVLNVLNFLEDLIAYSFKLWKAPF